MADRNPFEKRPHDPGKNLPIMELFWHRLQADLKLGVSMEDALRQWATSCRAETIPVAEALTYATSEGADGEIVRSAYEDGQDDGAAISDTNADPTLLEWQHKLTLKADGRIQNTAGNLRTILTCDSRIKGRIRWDTFWDRQEVSKEVPWAEPGPWLESTTVDCQVWLEHHYGVVYPFQSVRLGTEAVARHHRHSSIVTYLQGLTWDRRPRVEKWLHTYMGVADWVYAGQVGRAFLVGAVARVHRPGVELGGVLVLCGTSNKRHEALRHLFGSRVSDYWRRGGRGPDATGIWCQVIESNEESRSFALSCTDGAVARTSVVATMAPAPINEPRCWNASIEGHVDVLALARDADQLWAEAYEMYLEGARPELDQHLRDIVVKEPDAFACRYMQAATTMWQGPPIDMLEVMRYAGLAYGKRITSQEYIRAENTMIEAGWKRSLQGWIPGWAPLPEDRPRAKWKRPPKVAGVEDEKASA